MQWERSGGDEVNNSRGNAEERIETKSKEGWEDGSAGQNHAL